MKLRRLTRNEEGAAVIEMAFALPILIVMIWMIVQLGLVFRAMSGIQHALGEGARARPRSGRCRTPTISRRG